MSKVEAKEHYRNAAGLIIPGVTTALSELAKPALIRWANKLGLEGIDSEKYKDELADIGILSHYFVMTHLSEEVPEVDDYSQNQISQATACYMKYLNWEEVNAVRPLLIEHKMVSERYQYGGQIDLFAISKYGFTLVDFKTNSKGIFPEMVYQVSAYWKLLEEEGWKVQRAVILRIGRNDPEGFDEKVITRAEQQEGFEIFARCVDIYNLKKGQFPTCTSLL